MKLSSGFSGTKRRPVFFVRSAAAGNDDAGNFDFRLEFYENLHY